MLSSTPGNPWKSLQQGTRSQVPAIVHPLIQFNPSESLYELRKAQSHSDRRKYLGLLSHKYLYMLWMSLYSELSEKIEDGLSENDRDMLLAFDQERIAKDIPLLDHRLTIRHASSRDGTYYSNISPWGTIPSPAPLSP